MKDGKLYIGVFYALIKSHSNLKLVFLKKEYIQVLGH